MGVQPCLQCLVGSHGGGGPVPAPPGVPSCIHGDKDGGPTLKLWVTGVGTQVHTPSVPPRAPCAAPGRVAGVFRLPGWHPNGCPLSWVTSGAGMVAAPHHVEPCTGRVGRWGPPSAGDDAGSHTGTQPVTRVPSSGPNSGETTRAGPSGETSRVALVTLRSPSSLPPPSTAAAKAPTAAVCREAGAGPAPQPGARFTA